MMDSRSNRRSIRLKQFDYSRAGGYFVTLCVQFRRALFGKVQHAKMNLTPAGEMIRQAWLNIPMKHAGVTLDDFVVMPNHFHGIVLLNHVIPYAARVSLSDVVGRFKSFSTTQYIAGVHQDKWSEFKERLWQRNYYERVIRDDNELGLIRQYIRNNPERWAEDLENPEAQSTKSFAEELDQLLGKTGTPPD